MIIDLIIPNRWLQACDTPQRTNLQTQLFEILRANDRIPQAKDGVRESLKLDVPNL
jgi:hypothetical protein